MDLTFDRGSRQEPKGHALLYFRNRSNAQEVWATYVVILPITVDVSKYVPPFLMNQVGEIGPKDLSAFAFPPTPEQVESYDLLDSLAQQRDDDILFAGNIDPNDVAQGMMSIRFAVDGSDSRQVEEAEQDIRLLARHFPNNHNIPRLVRAAKSDDRRSAELADLYLRRCYFLVHEEYARLAEVERRLTELEDSQPAG